MELDQTQLKTTTERIDLICRIFTGWNIIFFIVALLTQSTIDEEALGSVLLRSGVFVLGGALLLWINSGVKKHQRGAWIRLRIISALAPLGVIAFIMFTPKLPLWFDISHAVSGILIFIIAFYINKKHMRTHFSKK